MEAVSLTLEELQLHDKNALANHIYNNWIAGASDAHDKEETVQDTGKRIPYMGWYWREIDAVNRRIPIGVHDDYVAVMARNKWGYPGRWMNDEEAATFIGYIDRAIIADRSGGVLAEITANRNDILRELAEWMQTLADVGEWE